ncbi:MAG: DUF1844 domain-containing protein [bacterium]|nr:DUF1844 domain-containing protein [bacterium]
MSDEIHEQDSSDSVNEDQPADETAAAEQAETFDLASAGVDVILRFFLSILGQFSWRSLGLVSDPKTGQVKIDLENARLAIDVMGDILERLSPSLSEAEVRDMKNLLTNLRLNFVEKSKEKVLEPTEGEGKTETEG